MIHSGSVIAAGISQGRSTSLKRDFKVSPSIHTCELGSHECVSAGLLPMQFSRSLGLPQHPAPVPTADSTDNLACSQSRWLQTMWLLHGQSLGCWC